MTPSTHRATTRSALAAFAFSALAFGAGALGTLAMRGKGSAGGWWFRTRRKPSFQPPDEVFGPVWTVLYGLMAYSAWRIWRTEPGRARSQTLGLWAGQLALNAAWTPLFFRWRKPAVALADLGVLDVAASAYAISAARVDRGAAWTIAPYLGWLGYATALNGAIVAKN